MLVLVLGYSVLCPRIGSQLPEAVQGSGEIQLAAPLGKVRGKMTSMKGLTATVWVDCFTSVSTTRVHQPAVVFSPSLRKDDGAKLKPQATSYP